MSAFEAAAPEKLHLFSFVLLMLAGQSTMFRRSVPNAAEVGCSSFASQMRIPPGRDIIYVVLLSTASWPIDAPLFADIASSVTNYQLPPRRRVDLQTGRVWGIWGPFYPSILRFVALLSMCRDDDGLTSICASEVRQSSERARAENRSCYPGMHAAPVFRALSAFVRLSAAVE
mmetsp:Transcript_28947/g.58733  ORF Transcript_28947/g.58733 Transcript_28947/m.58733 type:complete len:173 (-) Transcript_28947:406-924(-)